MLRHLRLVSVALLVTLLSAFALAPARASAAPAAQGSNPFKGHALTADVKVELASITHKAGKLVASGRVLDNAGQVLGTFADVPVTLQQQPGQACRILHLDLGPIFLDLLGLQVRTNRIVIDVTAVPGPGNLLGNLLCAIAHLLDDATGLNQLLALLNQLNGLLSQAGGALTGTGAGTLTGMTANVVRFVKQNGRLAAVIELRNAAGQLVDTVTALVAPQQATCRILLLDIGPIFLDILGLQIRISPIRIEITAVPGPGNLLGNLLCAIARLLDPDGPNASGAAAQLNRLIRQFR